jgi:peptide/nickel transport system permease protein
MTVNPTRADERVTESAMAGADSAVVDDPAKTVPERVLVPSRWRGFLRNWNNVIGLTILVIFVGAAVISTYHPFGDVMNANLFATLQGPSLHHLFGTDKLGRDIFARSIEGLRISLIIGFSAAAISLIGGVIFGTLAATAGPQVDRAVSTFVDMMMAFPHILFAVIVVSIFGSGALQLIIALGIASIPAAIRLQRSMALTVTSSTYMDAARMANAKLRWNLFKHVLPNTLAPMSVVAAIYAADAILAETGLSYLGLGIIEPQPSLGNIIADGQEYLHGAWWISTFPGLIIVVVSVSLHFLSDGIREQLDPELRKVVMVHQKDQKEKSWLRRLKG